MPVGNPSSEFPPVPQLTLDFVEAALYSGRAEQARTHLRIMRESGCAALSTRINIVVAAAEALTAEDKALFEGVLTLAGIERWPFERARVELAYGRHLRQARAYTAARRYLDSARTRFEQLGATPWAEKATDALRASGHSLTRNQAWSPVLTAQELKIVALAARGLTNKQIGDQLLMSHRTVAAHLHHAFPKLGITTRAALHEALSRYNAGEPDGGR